MQVTIQSIPANLQEFETLAAGGKQPERHLRPVSVRAGTV